MSGTRCAVRQRPEISGQVRRRARKLTQAITLAAFQHDHFAGPPPRQPARVDRASEPGPDHDGFAFVVHGHAPDRAAHGWSLSDEYRAGAASTGTASSTPGWVSLRMRGRRWHTSPLSLTVT